MPLPKLEYEIWLLERMRSKSKCVRRRVAAAIFSSGGILLATGYNRPDEATETCEDDCPRAKSSVPAYAPYKDGPGRCIAVHAEEVALRKTKLDERKGGTMIITEEPCQDCLELLKDSGLAEWIMVKN